MSPYAPEFTLRAALAEIPVPPAVAPVLVDAFDDAFFDTLVDNPALTTAALTKHVRSLEPAALEKLLYQGRLEVLAGVLASPENRSSVINSLLGAFELSTTDLTHLAERNLPQAACDTLLYSYRHDLEDALNIDTILERASADARLQYLSGTDITDQDMLELLLAGAASTRSPLPLISVLLARPALRTPALVSEIGPLVIAACWCELDPALHEAAANAALALSPPATLAHAYNPVIGLLNQPTLVLSQRRRLEDYVFTNREALRVPSSANKGLSRNMTMTPTPVALRDQAHDLDAIIKPATEFAHGPSSTRYVATTTPLLFELSKNPHLSAHQTLLVIRALLRHFSVMSTPRNMALFDATIDLIRRLDKDSLAGNYVTQHVDNRRHLVNHPLGAAFARTYPTTTPSPLYTHRPYYNASPDPGTVDWDIFTTDSIASLAANISLAPLGNYLVGVLGDGTEPASQNRWLRFFRAIFDDNSQTVPDLIRTALRTDTLQGAQA